MNDRQIFGIDVTTLTDDVLKQMLEESRNRNVMTFAMNHLTHHISVLTEEEKFLATALEVPTKLGSQIYPVVSMEIERRSRDAQMVRRFLAKIGIEPTDENVKDGLEKFIHARRRLGPREVQPRNSLRLANS